jgi:hypothetical protein
MTCPSADSGSWEFLSEAISGTYEPTPKDYNDVGEDGNAVIAAVADAPGANVDGVAESAGFVPLSEEQAKKAKPTARKGP